jgi:hypothetical protein
MHGWPPRFPGSIVMIPSYDMRAILNEPGSGRRECLLKKSSQYSALIAVTSKLDRERSDKERGHRRRASTLADGSSAANAPVAFAAI